jgi:hypothetical protein
MSYHRIPNWPPVWTHGYSRFVKTVTGEVGILKHVAIHDQMPSRCYLITEHEGERYTGCLLFDDSIFCHQMRRILEDHIDRSIREIGDLDLRFTL